MNYMLYAIIIEKGPASFGAYIPELPGCVAVGESDEEAKQLIPEAIEFYLEGMKLEGSTISAPVSNSELVEVAA